MRFSSAQRWPEDGFQGWCRLGTRSRQASRNASHQQESVWAGKPVHYATKAAQCSDRHELIVAGSVWDHIEKNDYLTLSCTCGDGPSGGIWKDFEIQKLPESAPERQGRRLVSSWCTVHGEDCCNAILERKKNRTEVSSLREAMLHGQMAHAIRAKARRERDDRRNRLRGLSA